MRHLTIYLTSIFLTLLTACASNVGLREQTPVTDTAVNGTWLIRNAELAGKIFPMPPKFELSIDGAKYAAGLQPPNDYGKLIFFGDEVAGEAARLDVIGESGPNKGKRILAIYRIKGRELEICYDLSAQERPRDFVSRDGTKLLRVTYVRK